MSTKRVMHKMQRCTDRYIIPRCSAKGHERPPRAPRAVQASPGLPAWGWGILKQLPEMPMTQTTHEALSDAQPAWKYRFWWHSIVGHLTLCLICGVQLCQAHIGGQGQQQLIWAWLRRPVRDFPKGLCQDMSVFGCRAHKYSTHASESKRTV